MNFSFTNSKPTLTIISILVIAWAFLRVAPWVFSHIHLTSLQSQLNDLNKSILSNSQQRQELDTKISNLRKEQSKLSQSNVDIRKQRDALEAQIAEQMGLGTGGGMAPLTTTQSWSQVEK